MSFHLLGSGLHLLRVERCVHDWLADLYPFCRHRFDRCERVDVLGNDDVVTHDDFDAVQTDVVCFGGRVELDHELFGCKFRHLKQTLPYVSESQLELQRS